MTALGSQSELDKAKPKQARIIFNTQLKTSVITPHYFLLIPGFSDVSGNNYFPDALRRTVKYLIENKHSGLKENIRHHPLQPNPW